jgi:hypothetical protein
MAHGRTVDEVMDEARLSRVILSMRCYASQRVTTVAVPSVVNSRGEHEERAKS